MPDTLVHAPVMGEATSVVCGLRPQKEVAHGASRVGMVRAVVPSRAMVLSKPHGCKNAPELRTKACTAFCGRGARGGASPTKRVFPLPTHGCHVRRGKTLFVETMFPCINYEKFLGIRFQVLSPLTPSHLQPIPSSTPLVFRVN